LRIKSYLVVSINDSFLWYKILGDINKYILSKLVKNELVKGLPHIALKNKKLCDAFKMGKQVKISSKCKNHFFTKRPRKLLHIDLFGPIKARSISNNRYVFVIMDDFTRYTRVLFLKPK
jgi:hypothetical protein